MRQLLSRSVALVPLVLAALVPAGRPVHAQTACLTPNCAFGATPAVCQNRAVPRTRTVQMTQIAASFVFDPANPKIEPGDCVIWRAANFQHSSSGNACPTSTICGAPAPAACEFETANVSAISATPTSTCFYAPATFPAGTGQGYFCRFHGTPTTGMRGTLRVTTEIKLLVDKDTLSGAVKLSWSGGGVAGDASYKVEKNGIGDPKFPAGSTTTLNPDGSVLGTAFTDPGELSIPSSRYYLIRNKQTNEP